MQSCKTLKLKPASDTVLEKARIGTGVTQLGLHVVSQGTGALAGVTPKLYLQGKRQGTHAAKLCWSKAVTAF
eukprot:1144464-Pelagomonas_calceolata.AAC.7